MASFATSVLISGADDLLYGLRHKVFKKFRELHAEKKATGHPNLIPDFLLETLRLSSLSPLLEMYTYFTGSVPMENGRRYWGCVHSKALAFWMQRTLKDSKEEFADSALFD